MRFWYILHKGVEKTQLSMHIHAVPTSINKAVEVLRLNCIKKNWSFTLVSYHTRGVFYVRREVNLMKTAKVNAYIMHIFGKIELLSIYAT